MLYKFLTVLSIFSASVTFAVDLPKTGEKRKLPADVDIVSEQPPAKKNPYALHKACKEGNIEEVKALLMTEDINKELENDGFTPILVAFLYGQDHVVDILLLDENIDINTSDKNGESLLHYACRYPLKERAVKFIEKLMARPLRIFMNACNKKHETPLYVACATNNLSVVKELLKHPRTDVNFCDLNLQGPLHVACSTENSEEVVEELLKRPELDVERCCRRVMCEEVSNPLYRACQIKPEDHMDYINPLHLACEKGNKKVVKLLLDTNKIDPNELTSTFEHSLLTTAIKYNKPKIVKFLFKNGYGDIENCQCGHGIIHIIKGYLIINKEISSDDEVIIGAFMNYQWKKLSFEVKKKLFCLFIVGMNIKTNVAKFILENQKFDKSELLFYSCAKNYTGALDTVKILIENFNVAVNQQNKDNLYPLDTVLTKYSPSLTVSEKEDVKNLIEYLLNKGAGYSESFDENENTKDVLEEIKLKILENAKFIE